MKEQVEAGAPHPCPRCAGKGTVVAIDPASMRRVRLAAGRGLRELAGLLGVSASYLCDIELGRRGVTAKILTAYLALEKEA